MVHCKKKMNFYFDNIIVTRIVPQFHSIEEAHQKLTKVYIVFIL